MPNRNVYNAKLCFNGQTARERNVNRTRSDIAKTVVDSLSYKEVYINEVRLQFLEIVATKDDNKKRFTTMPNEFVNLGDLITWGKMHWLVTKVDFDDEIVLRGEIEQCNMQLVFQNRLTLDVVKRWCIATRQYTSNIETGSVLSVSNREYKVYLPYDKETSLVDIDRRFLLEKIGGEAKAYRINSVDTLTNRYQDIDEGRGVLVWNMEHCALNPGTDNSDLMIADYIPPDTALSPNPELNNLLKCEITGRDTIIIGGSQRIYKAKFYTADGLNEVTDNITPIWGLNVPPEYKKYVKMSLLNGNFTVGLQVIDNELLVGTKIKLTLSDANNTYSPAELVVEVVSTIG